jgi:hypothetical protein
VSIQLFTNCLDETTLTINDMVFGFRKRGEAPEDMTVTEVGRDSDDKSFEGKNGTTATSTAIDAGMAAEAARNLKAFKRFHALDANLPIDELNAVEEALQVGDAEKEVAVERAILEDNSPYPEVCLFSATTTLHDPSMTNIAGACIRQKL